MSTRLRVVLAFAFIAAVALGGVGGIWLSRPEAPDLADPGQWTVIKAQRLSTPSVDIRVLRLRHESTAWDSVDLALNRIEVVAEGGKALQSFQWQRASEMAAGWCEVESLGSTVAVILFESEHVARVVSYSIEGFVFRQDRDALVTPLQLRYEGLDHKGRPEFFGYRSANLGELGFERAWTWTPVAGFEERAADSAAHHAGE